MLKYLILIILFISTTVFGQINYDYDIDEDLYLLLVKQQEQGIYLLFQDINNSDEIHIYKNVNKYEIELVNTIDVSEKLGLDFVEFNIYSVDYINGTLYLSIIYKIIDDNNEEIEYKRVISIDEEVKTILDYSEFQDAIYEVQMSSENEGLMLKGDTVLVTWNKWDKIEKQAFDHEIINNKVAYINSLKDIVICERDDSLNLSQFIEIDLWNPSVDYEYTSPINIEDFNNKHYKPYSLTKTSETDVYFSFEYANDDDESFFEIHKSSNNGTNWERLYDDKLSKKYLNGTGDIDKKFTRIDKIAIEDEKIVAVNLEKIIFSSNGGENWNEIEYDFANDEGYRLNKNSFPFFIEGEPFVFTPYGIVTTYINSVSENSLKVYPNPVKDYLRVDFKNENINFHNLKIELVNITSAEKYEINDFKIVNSFSHQLELNLDSFISGAYLLNIKSGDLKISKKIIIE